MVKSLSAGVVDRGKYPELEVPQLRERQRADAAESGEHGSKLASRRPARADVANYSNSCENKVIDLSVLELPHGIRKRSGSPLDNAGRTSGASVILISFAE